MVSHKRPKEGPRSSVVLQYRKAVPYEGRTIFKAKKIHISRFRKYVKLELYLIKKCGGGHRKYPGGADYPVITYTKYQEDHNERQLRTEPWRRFAASVSYILIKREKCWRTCWFLCLKASNFGTEIIETLFWFVFIITSDRVELFCQILNLISVAEDLSFLFSLVWKSMDMIILFL